MCCNMSLKAKLAYVFMISGLAIFLSSAIVLLSNRMRKQDAVGADLASFRSINFSQVSIVENLVREYIGNRIIYDSDKTSDSGRLELNQHLPVIDVDAYLDLFCWLNDPTKINQLISHMIKPNLAKLGTNSTSHHPSYKFGSSSSSTRSLSNFVKNKFKSIMCNWDGFYTWLMVLVALFGTLLSVYGCVSFYNSEIKQSKPSHLVIEDNVVSTPASQLPSNTVDVVRKRQTPMVRFDANEFQELPNYPLMFSNRLAQSNQMQNSLHSDFNNSNQLSKQITRTGTNEKAKRDSSYDREYDSERQAFNDSNGFKFKPVNIEHLVDLSSPSKDKSNCPPFIYDELPSFMVNDKSKYSIFNDSNFQQQPSYLKSSLAKNSSGTPDLARKSPLIPRPARKPNQAELNLTSSPISNKPTRKKLTALSISHSAIPKPGDSNELQPPMLPSQPPPSLSYLSLAPNELEPKKKATKPARKTNREQIKNATSPKSTKHSSPTRVSNVKKKSAASKKPSSGTRHHIAISREPPVEKSDKKHVESKQMHSERTRLKSGSSIHCVNRELIPHRCFCNESGAGFSSNVTHAVHESVCSTANSSTKSSSRCSNLSQEFMTKIKIIRISSGNQIINSDCSMSSAIPDMSSEKPFACQAALDSPTDDPHERNKSFSTFPINCKNVKLLTSSIVQTSLPSLAPEMDPNMSLYTEMSKTHSTHQGVKRLKSVNSVTSLSSRNEIVYADASSLNTTCFNVDDRRMDTFEEYDNDVSTQSRTYNIHASPDFFRIGRFDYENHDLHFV